MSAGGEMIENEVTDILYGEDIVLCDPTVLEVVEELSVVIEDDLEKGHLQ